jgi:hypothetical protein
MSLPAALSAARDTNARDKNSRVYARASRQFAFRARVTTLAMAIGVVMFAATVATAQTCAISSSEGCAHPGAACKPISSGTGSSGKCTPNKLGNTGKFSCRCEGTPIPPGPTFDAGCSNRNAQGKFTCTIDQPNVTQHETEYPNVQFAPGDVVQVHADGCVQTGGHGNTWKRYVNPSGDNSDHLYHGLIRIPTGTQDSALVRINTVMNRNIEVTGTGVPLTQLDLHLGYEDDGYSDNGYYSHDDGTEDQCKDPVLGGPAFVTVKIFRGVPPEGQQSRFNFDVFSNLLDVNGLPYNPSWSWQQMAGNQGKIPDTSMCHNFSSRGSTLGIPNEFMSPDFGDCTDQPDSNSVDLPIELNATICNYGSEPYVGSTFAGHLNWFPVTLEGTAGWGDHGADDDYTFTFTNEQPGNPLSVNGRNGLHVEFDSDETIDHFTSDEWNAFHSAVDNGGNAKQLFDGHTILTGMFGLDGEHNMKAELHPLYAIATLRDSYENSQGDEAWLMFVRNQGDEGFCSSSIWGSGFEDYTFRLPWRAGMSSVDVNWSKTQFVGTDGTSGPTVSALLPPLPGAGVYVKFHLGPTVQNSQIFGTGASIPFIDGALHLIWSGQPVATNGHLTHAETTHVVGEVLGTHSVLTGGHSIQEDETDDVERSIDAAMNGLTPAARTQVRKARAIASTQAVSVHRLTATGPVQKMTAPPFSLRIATKRHAIKEGPATRKVARDAAQVRALCSATHNAPAGLPASACTNTTASH